MKKLILLLSLLVVVLFVVSCAPAEEVSDEEIESNLEDLSTDELVEVATSDDETALAGMAPGKDQNVLKVSAPRYRKAAVRKLARKCGQATINSDFSNFVAGLSSLNINPVVNDNIQQAITQGKITIEIVNGEPSIILPNFGGESQDGDSRPSGDGTRMECTGCNGGKNKWVLDYCDDNACHMSCVPC